jgi:RHS repeat-associated protein
MKNRPRNSAKTRSRKRKMIVESLEPRQLLAALLQSDLQNHNEATDLVGSLFLSAEGEPPIGSGDSSSGGSGNSGSGNSGSGNSGGGNSGGGNSGGGNSGGGGNLGVCDLGNGDANALRFLPIEIPDVNSGMIPLARFGCAGGSPDDFVSRVKWSDGLESVGFVRPESDGFKVYASRYLTPDVYVDNLSVFNVAEDTPAGVTISSGPRQKTASESIVASTITTVPKNVTVVEGHNVEGSILSFKDLAPVGNYGIEIAWPDGTFSQGSAVPTSTPGDFDVLPGVKSFPTSVEGNVKITITSNGVQVAAYSSIVVKAAKWIVEPVSTLPVQGLFFSGQIGRMHVDAPNVVLLPGMELFVRWGDGTVDQRASIGSPDANGNYPIYGSHLYYRANTYGIHVEIYRVASDGRRGFSRFGLDNVLTVLGPDQINRPDIYGTAVLGVCNGPIIGESDIGGTGYVARINVLDHTNIAVPNTLVGMAGEPITGEVSTLIGGPAKWLKVFSFGDGKEIYEPEFPGHTITYKYDRPGSYQITGRITIVKELPIGCTPTPIRIHEVPAMAGVRIEAPDVSVAAIGTTVQRGASVDARTLFSAGGSRNWTVATLEWGDGSVSLLQYEGGQWSVFAGDKSHSYKNAGAYQPRITILSDTKLASATGSILVNPEAPFIDPLTPLLVGLPQLPPKLPNLGLEIIAGKIVDKNPIHIGGAHEAILNWSLGDSPVSSSMEQIGGTNTFNIKSRPTFLAPGSYPVNISYKDQLDEMTWSQSVVVNSPEIQQLTVSEFDPGGLSLRRGVEVASFKSSGQFDPSRFRATIDWGDGGRTGGWVIAKPGSSEEYAVIGTHAYVFGDYEIHVTVQDGAATGASVFDKKKIHADESTAGAIMGLKSGDFEVVVDFYNPYFPGLSNPGNPDCDEVGEVCTYYVGMQIPTWDDNTINFGDGSGAYHIEHYFLPTGQPFNFFTTTGPHWYDKEYAATNLTTTVYGKPQLRATSVASANVFEAVTRDVLHFVEGASSSTTLDLLVFGPEAFNLPSSTAAIDWGNGVQTSASIVRNEDNSYSVRATPPSYSQAGKYDVSISINNGYFRKVVTIPAIVEWSSFNSFYGKMALENGKPSGLIELGTVPASAWSPPWASLPIADQAKARSNFRPQEYFIAGYGLSALDTGSIADRKTAKITVDNYDNLVVWGELQPSSIGLKRVFARIETKDGVGIQTSTLVNVVASGWSVTSLHRTNGLGEGHSISTGPSGLGSADVLVGTGDVRLTHPVDLDASPGSDVSGSPDLVYDSGTANVRPIIEGILTRRVSTVLPSQLSVRLLWGDKLTPTPWTSIASTPENASTAFDLAVQLPDVVAHSGIYQYQLEVRLGFPVNVSPTKFTIPNQGTLNPDLFLAARGLANVLVRDRQYSDYLGGSFDDKSAWGKGWSLSSAPRLILEENNDLLWADSYGTRRWTMNSADRNTWNTYRNSEAYHHPTLYPTTTAFSAVSTIGVGKVTYQADKPEFGSLTLDLSTLTFTYKGLENVEFHFNHLGLLTSITKPSSHPFKFEYDSQGMLSAIQAPDTSRVNQNSATFTLDPNGSSAVINEFGGRTVQLVISSGFTVSILSPDVQNRNFMAGTASKIVNQDWDGTAASFEYNPNIQTISKVRVGGGASVTNFVPVNSVALLANSLIVGAPLGKEDLVFGVNGLGNRVDRFIVDEESRIVSLLRHDGETLIWTRNSSTHAVENFRDGRGIDHSYQYNNRGLLSSVSSPAQGTQTFTYSNDLIATWTWPQLACTVSQTYQYFSNMLLKTLSGSVPSNESITISGYETQTVTDERGYRTRYMYDQFGRVIETYAYLAGFIEMRIAKYEYDSNGNVKTFTDGDGYTWTKNFDGQNRLRDDLSPLGYKTSTEYWAFGPVKKATSATGSISTYEFNPSGLLATETHAKSTPDEQTTSYYYLPDQSLYRAVDPTGFETRTEPIESWSARKRKTSQQVSEAAGLRQFWTISTRDGNGNTIHSADDLSNVVTTQYDDADRPIVNVVTPSPLQVTASYVDQAIVTTFTTYELDGLTKGQTVYQNKGGISQVLSSIGYVYNDRRQLIKENDWNAITEYKYDLSGNLNYVKTPEGLLTETVYNSLQLPRFVTTTDLSGRGQGIESTSTMLYDWRGNLVISFLTGTGISTSQVANIYDADGRLTKTTKQLDGPDAITDFEYYADNLLKKETLPVHNANADRFWTQYTYDKLGRARTATDPLGVSTTEYFTSARKTVSKDRKGNETESIADELGRTVLVRAPQPSALSSRPVSRVEYNRGARTETSISPDNSKVATLRNYFGHDVKDVFTSADGATNFVLQVNHVDADGQVTETLDRYGNTTKTIYSRFSRMATIIAPNLDGTRTDTQEFDLSGNMTKYTIGSQEHNFVYDGYGNQVKWTDANGKSVNREFDAMGNVTKIVDRNGRVTKLGYDNQGRKVDEKWFATSVATNPVDTITTLYHPAGNISSVSNVGSYGSGITYAYDNAARINSSTMSANGRAPVTYGYQYDANSNRTNLQVALAGTNVFGVSYGIDGLDRVFSKEQTATTLPGQSASNSIAKKLTFGFLVDGRLDFVNRYANTFGNTAVRTKYQYNSLNLLSGVTYSDGTASNVYFAQQLGWKTSSGGPIGFRLLTNTKTVGSNTFNTTYAMYGDLQLKSENTTKNGSSAHSKSYLWDQYGNPSDLSAGQQGPSQYSIGVDNRLLRDLAFDNLYDDNGSLIRRTNRADGTYELYTWNHRGKMTSSTAYNSSNQQQWKEEYFYDPLGRLAQTRTTEGTGTPTSKFQLFDGVDLEELLLELDTSGRITKTVLHGPSVDTVMAEESIAYGGNGQATIALSWPMSDHQGTPVALLREPTTSGGTRTVENLAIRTSFGVEIANTGSNTGTDFGFQGHIEDSKTGFTDFRARQLSTTAGRFISQDPMGFAAGDTNLYRYVGNRPTMATDPNGLEIKSVAPIDSFIERYVKNGEITIDPSEERSYLAASIILHMMKSKSVFELEGATAKENIANLVLHVKARMRILDNAGARKQISEREQHR